MAKPDCITALPRRERRDFSKSELDEIIRYDPETGEFVWIVNVRAQGGYRRVGESAGGKSGICPYRRITVFGKTYVAQQLAWLTMTGSWPPKFLDLDHANRDPLDNRWVNLRLGRRSQNNINAGPSRANKSGVKGVSWVRRSGKWDARITVDKRLILLGQYRDLQEAIAARVGAELRYYGAFSYHRPKEDTMPFVTNNGANPIAFGSQVVPMGGTTEFSAVDWAEHSKPAHVKTFLDAGVISVQDKAPKGAEPAEAPAQPGKK